MTFACTSLRQIAKAKFLIGDPSYFPEAKRRPVGKVVRSIVLLDHPLKDTSNSESVQIIVPASEVRGGGAIE